MIPAKRLCVVVLASWFVLVGDVLAATDPIAWWKLDEGSGSTTADSTGNGYTGTLVSSPTWVANTVSSNGLKFTTNRWVNIANSSGLHLTNTMTASVWIKPDLPGMSSPMTEFLAKGESYYSGWGLRYGPDGRIAVYMAGQNGNTIHSTATAPTNRWTHVAVTMDGASAKLYQIGRAHV